MKWITILIAAIALIACGEDSKKTGSETHWLSCETTADCNDGFVCSAGRCLPEDEVGNNASTNNAAANAVTSSNNTTTATNNGTTVTNNTNQADMCPLTGQPVPVDLAAEGTVFFDITNDSDDDWWVPTQGWFCDGWSIPGVGLTLGWRCGCECPNPGSPHVRQYTLVSALTGTHEFQWDGRGLVTYDECIECGDFGGGTTTETTGVRQPVAAGAYEVQVPTLTALPANCTELPTSPPTADCAQDTFDDLPGGVAESCPADAGAVLLSQPFTIPPGGGYSFRVSVRSP